MDNILYELTFGLIEKFISFSEACIDFLFTEIDIIGIRISAWALLGGSGLIILLGAFLVKKIAPLL